MLDEGGEMGKRMDFLLQERNREASTMLATPSVAKGEVRMIAAGAFLEWAEVLGNYYGTAVSALQHAKDVEKDLLLDIDVQGAVQVMDKLPEAVSIFILPPSPQVLEMRLRSRSEAE